MKTYSKPQMNVQVFEPLEFVAVCAKPTHWIATCRDVSCLIFDGAGPNDWTSDMNRGGCGQSHEFVLEGGMKPESNCWLLLNVRTRQPGQVNVNQYSSWFIRQGRQDGSGYELDPNIIDELKARGELVPGYYNDHVLGSNSMLVTDDIENVKHPS